MRNFMSPLIVSGMLALVAGCSDVITDADYDGVPDQQDCDKHDPHADRSDINNGCGCDGLKAIATCVAASDGGTAVTDGGVTPTPADNDCTAAHENFVRPCGAKDANGAFLMIPVCHVGLETCHSGVWGSCAGAVRPALSDACDDKDNDCDGVVDNGVDHKTDVNNCGACGHVCSDAKASAVMACVNSVCVIDHCAPGNYDHDGVSDNGCEDTCVPDPDPTEVCDRRDNDCDGKVDNGANCACPYNPTPNAVQSTRVCGNSTGQCRPGTQTCEAPGTWGPCVGTAQNPVVFPTADVCDGQDNNCDTKTDENTDIKNDTKNCGRCGNACSYAHAAATCVAGVCQKGSCDLNWYDRNSDDRDGCEYPCVPSGAEVCDNADNDCNGVKDDGIDVIIDVKNCGWCGNACALYKATAACVEGTCVVATCDAGQIDADKNPLDGCERPCTPTTDPTEVCDGQDNDCDGSSDNGIICACLNGAERDCGPDVGLCHHGLQTCTNGVWGTCTGGTPPVPDVCDGQDNNCDGKVDEGIDKTSDVKNCGTCGNVCTYANATAQCIAGVCTMGPCTTLWHDADKDARTGCEYPCVPSGAEVCDGRDNDCDGKVDNIVPACP